MNTTVVSCRESFLPSSPEHLQMSLAAAMTLGLKQGIFYRDARLYCLNLLLTYPDGCRANCSYCGLQKSRDGDFHEKSFIRVPWPTYDVKTIIDIRSYPFPLEEEDRALVLEQMGPIG
jgi:biotin synthase-related radical SAM superfamily protein